jgi:hypothetical protein
MVNGLMSCDVLPMKKANTSLMFFSSDLEDNGITDLENVELKFHIFNKDTWDTIIDSDVVTLNQ